MPEARLKILTTNGHESYLTALAKTGHEFYVITKYGNIYNKPWHPAAPEAPSNIAFVEFDEDQKRKLKSGAYDLVIIHSVNNLLWFFPFINMNFIFIAHITLTYRSVKDIIKSVSKIFLYYIFTMFHKTRFVSVGELKKKSWSIINGKLILPTPVVLPPSYPGKGYDRAVVVGNGLKERGIECGYDLIKQIAQKVPLTIIGNNPLIDGAIVPKLRSEFIKAFRTARIYVYAIRAPYNDGYNLAMLEAMAMGMAIVTIEHPSSPIVHKYNGLIGKNVDDIVDHIRMLIKNPSMTDELGRHAQETVFKRFPEQDFLNKWDEVMRFGVHPDKIGLLTRRS
jgi:glycosyltransferase involved in cell wall biosynthesis